MGGIGSSRPEKQPRQCRSIRFNISTDLAITRLARRQNKSVQRIVHDAVELYLLLYDEAPT